MKIIDRLLDRINIPEPECGRNYEEAVNSNRLEDAVLVFLDWAKDKYGWRKEVWEEAFKLGRELASEFCISIEEISTIQKYRYGGIFGFFISGLIHDLIGSKRLRLRLSSMSGLGYKFKSGELEIFGDKLIYLGLKMKGGRIILHGNAGNYVGREMEGGELIIEGNVRNWAGYGMKGGRLVIKGNAGNVLGGKMEDGEIVVYGSAGEWLGEDARGGKIEVRGRDVKNQSSRS